MEPTIEPEAIVERPPVVSRAIQFLITSLIIGLLTSMFRLPQKVSGTALVLAALMVAAFFGLVFLLVNRIYVGRNWARILWLVLILIGLPFAIPGNLQEVRRSVVTGCLSIIITLFQVAGTFLLFTGKSNAWFRARK